MATKRISPERMDRIVKAWELYLKGVPYEEMSKLLGVRPITLKLDVMEAKRLVSQIIAEEAHLLAVEALAERKRLLTRIWEEIEGICSLSVPDTQKVLLRDKLYQTALKVLDSTAEILGLRRPAPNLHYNQQSMQVILGPREAAQKVLELWKGEQ